MVYGELGSHHISGAVGHRGLATGSMSDGHEQIVELRLNPLAVT